MSDRPSAVLAGPVADGGRDPSRNLGQERHRILRELRRELQRHPAVDRVRGIPDGRFRELRAELDPGAFARDVETATLRVTWWPAPDGPEYVFHYSESTGFDCGWHRESNPHVAGETHYQERDGPADDYDYEAVSFSTQVPTRLCWTILDRLAKRLRSRE